MEETCQIRIQDIVDIETATLKIPSITISDQWGQRSVLPSCDVQPLNLIALDQPVKVKAIGGGVVDQEFTLKRFRKGYYVCSCPSFRFNREKRKFEKSCSHLVSHLGEVYEKRRVGLVRYFSTGEEEEEEEGGGGGGGLWKRVSSAQARQSHAKAFLSQRDSSAQSSGSFKDREGLKRNEELEEGGNPRGEESKNKVKVGGGREEAYNEGMVLESNSNKRSKPNNCLPNSILGDREEVDGSSGSETEEEVALPLKSRNHLPGTNSSPSNSRAKQRSIPTSSPSKRKKREEDQEDPVKLLLAKPWILEDDPNEKKKKKAMDPEGWWVSEKLDGVRAFWDGERLWSRQQLEWNAPSWWKDRLPKDITLDGELWMARGTFDQTSQICRTSRSTEWHQIKFMIFDAPSMAMRPVEQRWEELRRRFGDTERVEIDRLEGPCIKLVHHVKCRGRQHLIELLNEVEAKGGEGLMLRESGSRYEFRRGNTLYKLKTFHDAEAVVVGYAPGEGRNSNRTGALICRMENGTLFRVGSGLSDSMRSNPPPKGMVINYRFQQLSEEGYPRFPSFRGVAWDKSVAKDA